MAVPFDKGICVMKKATYHKKLEEILNLPQFEPIVVNRKNAKHIVLKEEETIITEFENIRDNNSIDEHLRAKLKPAGSQPASLYGFAKVHKQLCPVCPVLSMPGLSYHKIGIQIAEWLSKVKECQINSSTNNIADSLKDIHLEGTVGVVACTLVSHPSDPGSIPTVTNVENPFLLTCPRVIRRWLLG